MSKFKKHSEEKQMKERIEGIRRMAKNLEVTLKVQKKLVKMKENIPPALKNSRDLAKRPQTIRKVPHKAFLKNNHRAKKLIYDVLNEKINSGKKVDFHIDEINENDTVLYGKMSKLRYQSESMFTNLISSQMNFNEHFHSDLLLGHKEMEKTSKEHINLIELTCKYELGLRSFSSIDTDLYETVNTNGVNRFKKAINNLAKGILTTALNTYMGKYEDHPHLNSSKVLICESIGNMSTQTIQAGTIDPYTKQLIAKPVKNKVCLHIYDQSSVDIMFQRKLFISCPYIGCTNSNFTKRDILSVLNV